VGSRLTCGAIWTHTGGNGGGITSGSIAAVRDGNILTFWRCSDDRFNAATSRTLSYNVHTLLTPTSLSLSSATYTDYVIVVTDNATVSLVSTIAPHADIAIAPLPPSLLLSSSDQKSKKSDDTCEWRAVYATMSSNDSLDQMSTSSSPTSTPATTALIVVVRRNIKSGAYCYDIYQLQRNNTATAAGNGSIITLMCSHHLTPPLSTSSVTPPLPTSKSSKKAKSFSSSGVATTTSNNSNDITLQSFAFTTSSLSLSVIWSNGTWQVMRYQSLSTLGSAPSLMLSRSLSSCHINTIAATFISANALCITATRQQALSSSTSSSSTYLTIWDTQYGTLQSLLALPDNDSSSSAVGSTAKKSKSATASVATTTARPMLVSCIALADIRYISIALSSGILIVSSRFLASSNGTSSFPSLADAIGRMDDTSRFLTLTSSPSSSSVSKGRPMATMDATLLPPLSVKLNATV
jgi:hypothetical protein